MSKAATPKKSTRNRFSPAFKQEALALADRVGAAEAARQLEPVSDHNQKSTKYIREQAA